jgi:serine/threonine protein kinase
MTIREVYRELVKARRPIDFFGDIGEREIKAVYHKHTKIIHPDVAGDDDKYVAQQAMMLLNKLYEDAKTEYKAGIFNVTNTIDLYDMSTPIFEFEINGVPHRFYELFFRGEVANIFKGTNGKEIILLKVAADPDDNELLDNEFKTLLRLTHHSLPIVDYRININHCDAFTMFEIEGTPLPMLMEEYPRGLPAEHVMWMLERLLSVVGYLHFNKVVHGNIKPEHVIVTKRNHNVSLLGFSLSITDADQPDARYKVINDVYTPPEIDKDSKVMPSTDIYAVGKLAVLLLGGDVETNGMPLNIDVRIRDFVRKLVSVNPSERPIDAWMLWDEVIELRTKVFGKKKFIELK